MPASDIPESLRDLVRIDRWLERNDKDIDAALASNDRETFQHLLRRRGELLAERSQLGEAVEPPC